jgi:hypothetical protein
MSQRDKKKADGQRRAIAEHEAKKEQFPHKQDKDFAQKTIDNARARLKKLER